jgi:hypothetical protein
MSLFSKVLDAIHDGMQITFTPDNVAVGDTFLNLHTYEKITCTFHTAHVPFVVDFDGNEPWLLEECPDSFSVQSC